MTVNDLISALVDAGASPQVIKISVAAFIEAGGTDAKKAHRQERNRRYYEARRLIKTGDENDKTSESVLKGVLQASESVLKSSENDPSRMCARVLYGEEEVSNITPIEPTVLSPTAKPKRSKPRRAIGVDEQPSAAMRGDASHLSGEIFRAEFRKFRDHHVAKGSLMANWDAAWRTWLGNMNTFAKPNLFSGKSRDAPLSLAERMENFVNRGSRSDQDDSRRPPIIDGNVFMLSGGSK